VKEVRNMLLDIAGNELGSLSFRVNLESDKVHDEDFPNPKVVSQRLRVVFVQKRLIELKVSDDGILIQTDQAFSRFGGWHIDAETSKGSEREWRAPSVSSEVRVPRHPDVTVVRSNATRPDLMAVMKEHWAKRDYIPSTEFCKAIQLAPPDGAPKATSVTHIQVLDEPTSAEPPQTPKTVPNRSATDGNLQIRQAAKSYGVYKLTSRSPTEVVHDLKSDTYVSTVMPGHCSKLVWDQIMERAQSQKGPTTFIFFQNGRFVSRRLDRNHLGPLSRA
jgi:hypothetical protein